jgi:long-subunit fatty acid transport protein
MKHQLLTTSLLAVLLTPSLASANPEPTPYDARAIAMGITGTAFLDRPAALVINPANLDGIEKLGFSLGFTALLTNQRAPVSGPNTRVDSGIGLGPLSAGFIAGRIAPRVVFAGGIYIETGYGSGYEQVPCIDGDAVGPAPDFAPATETSDPPCTNQEPQSLNVTFFVGEFAAGFSFRAHEKFQLGVALRLPFSKQVADLWQNVGAAVGSGTLYARAKQNIGGVGHPTLRFGFTIKPHKKVRIGGMYRMPGKIKLTGTNEAELFPEPLDATSEWFIPHAFAIGISYHHNQHWLITSDFRMQFHAAEKTGNQNQTVVSTLNGNVLSTAVVPFGWRNSWSVKLGWEYRFTKDLLALRLGGAISESATTAPWAQYFTPPPGLSGNLTGGLGFYWDDRNDPSIKDKYQLDLVGAFAFTTGSIGNEYINQPQEIPGEVPPGTPTTVLACSGDQVTRTGCPGEYRVMTYWAGFQFTLQY